MVKNVLRTLFLCIMLVVPATALHAQNSVSGTVKDESGEPLAGVTVMIPGSTRGTSTSADGTYALDPGGSQTLEFSCIGYKSLVANISGAHLDVTLEEDATLLNDVVVVGYGAQKKVNLTGAVSVLESEQIENRTTMFLSNLLQGTVAGVNVTTDAAQPNSAASINVRGYTSINGGSTLVIVDGIEGRLNSVNPNDIESISVIKDASASAIYGGKAAYGVILITTKEAKQDSRPKVSFSGKWGWKTPTTSTDFETTGYWSVLTYDTFWLAGSGNKFVTGYNDADMMQLLARVHDKKENPERPWVIEEIRDGKDRWVYYGNYDWWHMLYNDDRPYQSYNINISGGAKGVSYMISGSYDREQGMFKTNPDMFNKYNLRAKISADITKWLTFSNNLSLASQKYTYLGSSVADVVGYSAGCALPIYPMQNPDGSWLYDAWCQGSTYKVAQGRHITLNEGKARATDKYTDLQNTSRLEIKFAPTFKATADFSYRFYQQRKTNRNQEFSYRINPGEDLQYYTTGNGANFLTEYVNTTEYYIANAYLSYDETYKSGHHLAITAGLNYEYAYYKSVGARGDDLISEELDDLSLVGTNDSGEAVTYVYGGQNDYALMGIFGRINYDYKERYLVEVSARYDGSSRFAKGHRWGLFPAASVGWRISEEPFFTAARDVVDNLKIRGSFGSLGNQDVSSYYAYMRLINTGTLNWSFGDSSTKPKYSYISDPVAGDLTWEITQQYDVGADLAMFKNRLQFTGDAYIRNTIGMLTEGMDLPSVYGADSPEMNAADLSTKGFEFTISWKDHFMLGNRLFEYSVGGNVSDYASYITKFQGNDVKNVNNYYEGMRLGEIWGYKTDGLFQSQEEVDEYLSKVNTGIFSLPTGKLRPGDVRYVDLNGDGVLNKGSETVDDPGDKTIIGNSLPSLSYGFNASVSYFGFDVSVFFQGSGNYQCYPKCSDAMFWGPYSMNPYSTYLPKNFLSRCWSEDNPDAYFPAPCYYMTYWYYLAANCDRYLQNCRYLRLKNLTVGYTVPQNVTRKISIDKIRVYFTAENLCYWSPIKKTAMNYVDPESIDVSMRSSSGYLDGGYYPWSKTFVFGVDISF